MKDPRKDPLKDDGSPVHVLWLPTIFIAGTAYIVSLIDFIPGLGPISVMDDLVVVIAMVWFFTSWLPKNKHRIYWFKPKTGAGPSMGDGGGAGGHNHAQADLSDPFDVLNVSRGASPDQIKTAYREMLSKYHPDKVAHLGEDFQKIAHEKAVNIQKAYEALCGKG
jgi:DnaJ like chaperone protein